MIEWLQSRLGISPELQLRLFATLATIVGLWLVHRIALGLVYRRVRDPWGRYRWRKGLTYVLVAAGVVIVGRMWFAGVQALATFLGLLSAGLAIALKDPVADLAGWAFIIWRGPSRWGTVFRSARTPATSSISACSSSRSMRSVPGCRRTSRPGGSFTFLTARSSPIRSLTTTRVLSTSGMRYRCWSPSTAIGGRRNTFSRRSRPSTPSTSRRRLSRTYSPPPNSI